LAFPFYYVAYVLSGAFFMHALVQLSQIYEMINSNLKR
jgi:hypothetical protein